MNQEDQHISEITSAQTNSPEKFCHQNPIFNAVIQAILLLSGALCYQLNNQYIWLLFYIVFFLKSSRLNKNQNKTPTSPAQLESYSYNLQISIFEMLILSAE